MAQPEIQRQVRQQRADIDALYELVERVDQKVHAVDVKLDRRFDEISVQLSEVLRQLGGRLAVLPTSLSVRDGGTGGVTAREAASTTTGRLPRRRPRCRRGSCRRTNVSASPTCIAWAGRNGRSPASWAAIRPRSAEILRRNADPATGAYRPFTAHRRALGRRPRPRPAKLAGDLELRTMVQQLLDRRWSPEQISYELRHRFPDQPERHLVPETIYQAIYVQGRGGLRRELHRALRTGRALRRPRRGTTAPTGCCASTFPRAPTCRYTPPPISPPSRPNSTHDPAKPPTGQRRPNASISYSNKLIDHQCCNDRWNSPANRWSHAAGKTSAQVVPSSWQPTGAASGPFLVARYFSAVNACAAGVASCFFEPRFSLSRYLTTMRRCSRIRRPRLSRCRYTFTPAPSSTARTNPGLQQLRGAQAAERHDYLGPARERGRAELSIPLPIVVVVRGVVAALEPGYSSFVIAGENSAVIEAGEAPRHGVHFTGPSREDHTTQVTYRAPGWAASSACRWVTW